MVTDDNIMESIISKETIQFYGAAAFNFIVTMTFNSIIASVTGLATLAFLISKNVVKYHEIQKVKAEARKAESEAKAQEFKTENMINNHEPELKISKVETKKIG